MKQRLDQLTSTSNKSTTATKGRKKRRTSLEEEPEEIGQDGDSSIEESEERLLRIATQFKLQDKDVWNRIRELYNTQALDRLVSILLLLGATSSM